MQNKLSDNFSFEEEEEENKLGLNEFPFRKHLKQLKQKMLQIF
jgi:hypothetical protein